ncbi:hypothetical protein [Mesorhizobium sp. A556]
MQRIAVISTVGQQNLARSQRGEHVSRDSVRQMLPYSTPPVYRRQSPIRRPKLDAFIATIDRWLEEDVSPGGVCALL